MKFQRFLLLALIFAIIGSPAFSQERQQNYSLVRVYFSPQFTFADAENIGLELEHAVIKPDIYIESAVSESTLRLLKERSVKTETVIEDLSEFYRNRALKDQNFLKDFKNDRTLAGSGVPQNFKLGSMGGFYTLQEAYSEFDSMREKFPNLVSAPEKIGTSIEGRPIFAYRISTPVFTNAKLEVLYTALHHAREPGGITTLTYFLWDILERFKSGDAEAKYLLENRELYIIPLINPDGYAYNQETDPGGGGLWRKNRRQVNNEDFGIDLNRNYGPQESWNAPNGGSATDPSLDNYRGSAPFSEPETQAVRNFCRSHAFKDALNYHSYGGLLIYPFATKQVETPDSAMYRALAAEFIKVNKYAAGTGLQTVGYSVRGDSDEWMYLTEAQKQKIIAMTPEIGTINDSFWPAPSRIIPQAQENLYMNYQLAWSAGVNIRPQEIRADGSVISVKFNNIGLLPSSDSVEVSAVALNPLVQLGTSFKKLSPLANTAEDEITFPYYLTNGFKNGERVKIALTTFQQAIPRYDTLEVQLFKSNVITLFNGSNNGAWNTGNSWGVITDHFGVSTFTDSPDGLYEIFTDNYLQYNQQLDLTAVSSAILRFKTRWSIESKGDFAVIQASVDNGNTWTYLKTSRMKNGNGSSNTQRLNSVGFTGNFPEWTIQEAPLDEFKGKKILLRFGMLSDASNAFDGWYLADIDLITYDNSTATTISEENLLKESFNIYPNPVLKGQEITISNPFKNEFPFEVKILNLLGETVFKNEKSFKNTIERIFLKGFPAGSYQVILRQNSQEISRGFVIQ
ncbi:MAG: M14 family zinc carboxypeptidase [Bacteroidota bacterium]